LSVDGAEDEVAGAASLGVDLDIMAVGEVVCEDPAGLDVVDFGEEDGCADVVVQSRIGDHPTGFELVAGPSKVRVDVGDDEESDADKKQP